jgi:hypothetical protein
MKATTGELPRIKISAALRANDVQISMASTKFWRLEAKYYEGRAGH